jgi:translation initiation factor 4G
MEYGAYSADCEERYERIIRYDEETMLKCRADNKVPPESMIQFVIDRLNHGPVGKKASFALLKTKLGAFGNSDCLNDIMKREINSILNKVSPANYEKLSDQIRDIGAFTKVQMEIIVTSILDKAIIDQAFSNIYAKLCKRLSPLTISVKEGNKTVNVKFLIVLLLACQNEFETETKRTESEMTETIKKRRSGLMRFIGELSLVGLLSMKIVDKCLMKLLENKETESLEMFCKLLGTISSVYWKNTNNTNHEKIKTELEIISKDENTCAKIKFAIQDLLEKSSED